MRTFVHPVLLAFATAVGACRPVVGGIAPGDVALIELSRSIVEHIRARNADAAIDELTTHLERLEQTLLAAEQENGDRYSAG